MECPMCGHNFKEAEGKACSQSCPLSKACKLIKCPRCGYEMPQESRLAKALRKWRKKRGSG